ncbi:hypothetical protein HMPREF9120_02347 [Neisseria sp. oral taxon 020 str. F0370]|nr:hypothetical protein HMPREF9120_02347 [Neisseria sp. oral taxon 020 str. F0370]
MQRGKALAMRMVCYTEEQVSAVCAPIYSDGRGVSACGGG